MKSCLSKSLYLLGIFLCFFSAQKTVAQSIGNDSINRFISSQAKIYRAVENEASRKIIYADLNKDGKKDAVVLYTLESFRGNNNYRQYIAIFIKTRRSLFKNVANKIIGGKNNRSVSLETVKDRKIIVSTLNYLPTDASCCPSRKEISQITFSGNKLKEVKIK